MNADLKKMCQKLGVERALSPYESQPWSVFDPVKSATMSAEVRLSGDGLELEAEIQIVRDSPESGEAPFEQLYYLRAVPVNHSYFSIKTLHLKGENKVDAISGWEDKACSLFRAVGRRLEMEEVPEFDKIMDEEFSERSGYGGQGGEGGGRSPKLRSEQLLGMKHGRGF